MKEVVKILYNGKAFDNIDKALDDEEEKLTTLGMQQEIENALMAFVPLIQEEGGQVTINIKGANVFEISTQDLSGDLKKKIVKALTPAP